MGGPAPGNSHMGMPNNGTDGLRMWCVVEVMGHQRYVGEMSEQVIAGQGFIRVDVPATDDLPAFTKFIGTGSIYAITPVDEQIARGMVRNLRARPIDVFELRNLLPAADYDEDQ